MTPGSSRSRVSAGARNGNSECSPRCSNESRKVGAVAAFCLAHLGEKGLLERHQVICIHLQCRLLDHVSSHDGGEARQDPHQATQLPRQEVLLQQPTPFTSIYLQQCCPVSSTKSSFQLPWLTYYVNSPNNNCGESNKF